MRNIGIGEFQNIRKKTSIMPRMRNYKTPVKTVNEEETVDLINRTYESKASANTMEEGQLSIDVLQNEHEIAIISSIAGVRKEDIHIILDEDTMTIKGERLFPIKDKNDYSAVTEECFWGRFSRSIILPKSIDKTGITASFKNNILIISIPKIDEVKSRIIRVE